MSYQFQEKSATGSDWVKDLLANQQDVSITIDAEDNIFNYTPGDILTTTRWNQSGTIYISKNNQQTALTGYTYNQFCPNLSPTSTEKTVTGCSNTADSQILYYWMEMHGYTFDLSVTTDDFYVWAYNGKNYYASDDPKNGEASISVVNDLIKKTTQLSSLQNGDFIAALNFFCGLKNNSEYGSSTSTTWYGREYYDGTNANVFEAAGFDSYFFIPIKYTSTTQKIITTGGKLNEVGYSIIQECIDYGEVVRIGIPGHAVYIDGYKKNMTTGRYEYHINYGWGMNNATTWYDIDAKGPEITYIVVDLSPDVSVRVTSKKSEYFGGSFLRGMQRINHIQNEKRTTFTFTDEVKNATITLTAQAAITSDVDVDFKNINVSLQFDDCNGFYSKQAMSFEMNSASIVVNFNDTKNAQKAIFLDGNEQLSVTMTDSWLFSGYHKDGLEYIYDVVNDIKDFTVSNIDPMFIPAISGTAVKSGAANDTISLSQNSAVLGDIDLGGGKNVITVENGSLIYGGFTGSADTLTVNMVINDNRHFGPMIALESASAENAFLSMSSKTINVTLNTETFDETFALLMGYSEATLKNYTVELTVGEIHYTLDSNNSSKGGYNLVYNKNILSLSSNDETPPAAPVVTADITEITNKNVTLTAKFAPDAVTNEYKLGNGAWQAYPANGVLMPENGEVSFRSTDAAGNISPVTVYKVENIDKVAPAAPVVEADIKTLTNLPVTLTATFDTDAVLNEYSINNGEWISYTAAVTLPSNATVKFRSTDAAGNISKETVYVVNYIDTVPPEAPKFTLDIETPTQQNVTVSATFDKSSTLNQYSLDGGKTWQEYNGPVVFTENGEVTFRSFDEFGNYIDAICVVDNIDRVAPVAPVVTASTTKITNQDVIITAKFESDTDKNEYSINNGEWKICTGTVAVKQNGTIRFRSTDAAGNVGAITEYTVDNIDKNPPDAPKYLLSTYDWTSGSVTVNGTFAADSVKNEYSINDGEWITYTGKFSVSENAKITLRSTDEANNSIVTPFNISNIDTDAPVITLSLSTTAKTPRPVTVTATADDADQSGIKLIEYSLDGKNWTAGTAVTVTQNNQLVFFRATDNVGNVSLPASEIINNIVDKKPGNNITGSGISQIIGYDAVHGKVGYVAIDNENAAEWKGIWEWSKAEADMWRVDGTGIFAGSTAAKDGILLYNGSNNTFAAWTDLGRGDYGYVSLLYVDGSFQTSGTADFGGKNEFNDIVIYDDKGSFGIVLDGTTYQDVWHNAENQPRKWELLGVGSFDGKSSNLVVKNCENNFITLWGNNDYTFATWDWSVRTAGFLNSGMQFCGVGDFKGDGKDDILLQNIYNNELWVWEDGDSSMSRWAGTLGDGFEVEAVGDYNGDCLDDILLREHVTGWGGMGYWGAGYAGNWVDLNARIETNEKSQFAIIA